MTASEFGALIFLVALLLSVAHVLGLVFKRLRQPRVVGEILAGLLLGPSVIGRIAPQLGDAVASGVAGDMKQAAVLGFLYHLGLLLLMFASGAEAKNLFRSADRRGLTWLAGVGTGLPLALVFVVAPVLPLETVAGPAGHPTSLLLIIGIATAVTSIPVISKIFHDLGIIDSRFARLVIAVAVLEDILLWGVLSVALGLAAATTPSPAVIASHVGTTVVYFAAGLLVFPAFTRALSRAGWNALARDVPVGWLVTVLFAYTALATALDVSLVFAAFLAGYAVASSEGLASPMATLERVSFAVFVPLYFAMVGYQLDLTRGFPLGLALTVLLGSCAVKLMAAWLGARLAGFAGRDALNLSITLNARGGPGIVLASVAYEARIINADFYTCLVLLAVLTSQAAGAWLDYVLRKGWPLLSGDRTAPAPAMAAVPGDTAASS